MPSFSDAQVYFSPELQELGGIDPALLKEMNLEELHAHVLLLTARLAILTERVKKLESEKRS